LFLVVRNLALEPLVVFADSLLVTFVNGITVNNVELRHKNI